MSPCDLYEQRLVHHWASLLPPFLRWQRASVTLHLLLTGLRVTRVVPCGVGSHYPVWAIGWGYTWADNSGAKAFRRVSDHWTRQLNAWGGCPKRHEIMHLLIRCGLYRLLTLNNLHEWGQFPQHLWLVWAVQRTPKKMPITCVEILWTEPWRFLPSLCVLQLFKGKFFVCQGEDTRNITNKSDCTEASYKWVRHKYNFDNLGQVLIER